MCNVMNLIKSTWLFIRWGKYYDNDGQPKKCTKCNSVNIREEVTGMVACTPSEINTSCADCGNALSFWAYGYYDPSYSKRTNAYKDNNGK